MKRADYVPVYGRRPWLMSEDLPEAGDYFREHGAAFHLARREQIRFGRDPRIFWIENGLCATFPTTGGEMPRFIGLFGRRTLLGGVRSLGHLGERMEITAVALAEVSGFSVPAPMFRTWVAVSPKPNASSRAFSSTTSAACPTACCWRSTCWRRLRACGSTVNGRRFPGTSR